MLKDGKVWIAQTEAGENVFLLPKMANRHGLVAGATGTGKTVTLKVLAESFSAMGVPVFMADVKGDISGMMCPGTDSPEMQKRIGRFGLADAGFTYSGCPVTIWDIFGEQGIPLRTTISEIGPVLLARILQLNPLQGDILSIVFKIADDSKLLLIDTKDLKAMLRYVSEHRTDFEGDYGKMSSQSLAAIMRAVVALELAGGDRFFGEPALQITDWLCQENGKGMIHILDSRSLIQNGTMYSTFLLWMISELFETLPEVGDMAKPKMVFFFDEAHLLFHDASKTLLDKIEQVVKLIRSKGVGIYFCTQNPADIPDGVLASWATRSSTVCGPTRRRTRRPLRRPRLRTVPTRPSIRSRPSCPSARAKPLFPSWAKTVFPAWPRAWQSCRRRAAWVPLPIRCGTGPSRAACCIASTLPISTAIRPTKSWPARTKPRRKRRPRRRKKPNGLKKRKSA